MHHHDVVIIISLQTHPAKLVSSWCMAPTLLCKDLLFPAAKSSNIFCSLLSFWHSPSQSCFSANAKIIFILKLVQRGISRIRPTQGFSEVWLSKGMSIVIVMAFLHNCWQSTNLPCYYTWHAAWPPSRLLSPFNVLLVRSRLRASCWILSIFQNSLTALQMVHHSMPASSLLLVKVRMPACHQ